MAMKTHGHTTKNSQSSTYVSYTNMMSRCYRKSAPNFDNYGWRGIQVCSRWKEGFSNFLEDMGERPKGSTLDRKDSNKDYSKENCRWASTKEQSQNRRTNVHIELNGVTKTLGEWAKQLGVGSCVITYRIKAGWDLEKALTHRPWSKPVTQAAQES